MIADIVHPGAKVLFVLESPHTEELQHGYPASGDSGREMSRVILGRTDIPLSLIIKCPCIATCLNIAKLGHIGIMNVSSIPLQESCYTGRFADLKPTNMEALKYIRDDLQKENRVKKKTFTDKNRENAQNEVFQNFRNRLDSIVHSNNIATIVPCGHFARYFVNRCKSAKQDKTSFTVIDNIPHPSGTGGGWRKLSQYEIDSLKSLSREGAVSGVGPS